VGEIMALGKQGGMVFWVLDGKVWGARIEQVGGKKMTRRGQRGGFLKFGVLSRKVGNNLVCLG